MYGGQVIQRPGFQASMSRIKIRVAWQQVAPGGQNVTTLVFETGRSALIDSYADGTGPFANEMRQQGVRSAVGTPILVEGNMWGVISTGPGLEQPLPPDTEARLASFTELVATAIANAESRAELMASRARIVAAADDTRRRIERDLHPSARPSRTSATRRWARCPDPRPASGYRRAAICPDHARARFAKSASRR